MLLKVKIELDRMLGDGELSLESLSVCYNPSCSVYKNNILLECNINVEIMPAV